MLCGTKEVRRLWVHFETGVGRTNDELDLRVRKGDIAPLGVQKMGSLLW